MTRLEVDVKSIQKLIRTRLTKAQKTLTGLENEAQKAVKQWVNKGLKSQTEGKKQVEKLLRDVRSTVEKSNVYGLAQQAAKDAKVELEKRLADTQEKVFKYLEVPTKQDLDRLNKKVDELTKKLKANGKSKK